MIAINLPPPCFEIGQLVKHKRYGYRGVIVAVDLTCQAPQEWYQRNQTQPERNQPWYHVIVHLSETTTYPAQSSLLADECQEAISNPMMQLFFADFIDGKYVRNEVPFHSW